MRSTELDLVKLHDCIYKGGLLYCGSLPCELLMAIWSSSFSIGVYISSYCPNHVLKGSQAPFGSHDPFL